MCSILMLGRYVCAPAWSTFYGWNLVVTGVYLDYRKPTDIANQVCNDSTLNEQVKASVCRINLAFLPTQRYSVLEISFCFVKYLFV